MTARWQPGLFERSTTFYQTLGSTMEVMRDAAHQGASHGATAVALQQTGGRGRHGRTWVSARGAGLWQTTLLACSPGEDLRGLTLCMGAAVLEGVHALGAICARLKWPNDILVGERKLAGVLAEHLQTAHGPRVLVGVGVNVSPEAPVQLRTTDPDGAANYIGLQSLDASIDLNAAHRAICTHLEAAWGSWQAKGMGPTLQVFDRHHALQGVQVRAQDREGRAIMGTVVGIDEHGGLRLLCNGTITTIFAGEVTRVRAFGQ